MMAPQEVVVEDMSDGMVDDFVDKLASRAYDETSAPAEVGMDSSTLGKSATHARRLGMAVPARVQGNRRVVQAGSAHVPTPARAPWTPSQKAMMASPAAAGLGASLGRRQPSGSVAAWASAAGSSPSSGKGGNIVRASSGGLDLVALSDMFCNLFAVWLTIAAIAAVQVPSTFTWIPDGAFTGLLGLLMFSVGITTTIDDFKACLTKPGAVAINFFSCYGIMPILAYVTGLAMKAEPAILAGLVLVGSINGGQASNLCTLIAGGDVALSVLMTTSTTLGCIVMTPLICQVVLGAVVPVNAIGIMYSTLQVVLAPIFLGVGVNTMAPAFAKAVEPYTPVAGVVATVLLVGAAVAKVAPFIMNAGLPLQVACLNLHLVGGILGYFATKALKFDERTCRTVAIETAMKSSAFGFLLASQHFGVFAVRVPSAVSVVWMAITGSLMAVYWKLVDPIEKKA